MKMTNLVTDKSPLCLLSDSNKKMREKRGGKE